MPQAIPIYLVDQARIESDHTDSMIWLTASGFRGDAGTFCLVPSETGGIGKVLVGRPDPVDTWTIAHLPQMLPSQTYTLGDDWTPDLATKLYLGWRLGQYVFDRYKQTASGAIATLEPPAQADRPYIEAATAATYLVRDLITMPANDMGPTQLEACARDLADKFEATVTVISGVDLLAQNYPLVHAVGRASNQSPRLIDLRWGNEAAPKVTLVGKGVCFDSGGLDIKPAAGMKMMKKDMGGAAQVLGLAQMVMQLDLPVRLRVLVPAVENSIADNAMHPLDVLPSRKGLTVEVGNTDAEGRLVLADALWEACSEDPGLLIDCATLTGAARIALGTELPAFFCSHESVSQQLIQGGLAVDDPLWQMPLHQPYRSMLESRVADLSNIGNSSYGGSITAALFLQEFVKPGIPWVHIDLMAWNLRSLPGRPEGGEAMGMRALFDLIRHHGTA